jgi:hypothetical protein
VRQNHRHVAPKMFYITFFAFLLLLVSQHATQVASAFSLELFCKRSEHAVDPGRPSVCDVLCSPENQANETKSELTKHADDPGRLRVWGNVNFCDNVIRIVARNLPVV